MRYKRLSSRLTLSNADTSFADNMGLSTEYIRLALVALVAFFVMTSQGAPAQLCAGAAEDDPRAARFCQALNTFLELYAEAAGEQVPEYQALVRDYPQLLDTGMKRQDVVHSFLRFGRRR